MRILMLKDLSTLNNSTNNIEDSFEILKGFLLNDDTEAFLAEENAFWKNKDFIKCNKHWVDSIDKTKIEIRSNEHPPAHFHVKIAEFESSYDIQDCWYMIGNLPRQYEKKVILRYRNGGKEKLIEKRNQTRPEHCKVWKI